jgi:hypothetical protein
VAGGSTSLAAARQSVSRAPVAGGSVCLCLWRRAWRRDEEETNLRLFLSSGIRGEGKIWRQINFWELSGVGIL